MGYEVLAERLKEEREAHAWNVGQLALYSGVSRDHIYRIEAGKRTKIGDGILGKLAAALGVTPAYLLGQTKERNGTRPDEATWPADVVEVASALAKLPVPVRGVFKQAFDSLLALFDPENYRMQMESLLIELFAVADTEERSAIRRVAERLDVRSRLRVVGGDSQSEAPDQTLPPKRHQVNGE